MVLRFALTEWPAQWAGAALTTVDPADMRESTQPRRIVVITAQHLIAPVQALLRLQGNGPHFLALAFLAFLHRRTDPRGDSIMMGRFHQRSSASAVARFGDPALLPFLPAGPGPCSDGPGARETL